MSESVLVERLDAVQWITINREECRNAINQEVIARTGDGIRQAVAEGARAIVLTGTGEKTFSAGADLARNVKGGAFAVDFSQPKHYIVKLFKELEDLRTALRLRHCGGGRPHPHRHRRVEDRPDADDDPALHAAHAARAQAAGDVHHRRAVQRRRGAGMGRVRLCVGSRETARAFFEQMPEGAAACIEAVAIDMTTAYELEIKAQCPNAEVVYDLFHVVAK